MKQGVKILIVWIFWLDDRASNTHSLNILTFCFVLLDLNSHFQFHTFIETDNGQTLNWDMYHFYLTKTFSEKSFQTLSDRIETVRKNRFLPFSQIFLLHMNNFGKNLLWEIASDAFGPNWVCRKESFPTFIIPEQIILLHIYTFSKKSNQDDLGCNWVWWERIVSYYFLFGWKS